MMGEESSVSRRPASPASTGHVPTFRQAAAALLELSAAVRAARRTRRPAREEWCAPRAANGERAFASGRRCAHERRVVRNSNSDSEQPVLRLVDGWPRSSIPEALACATIRPATVPAASRSGSTVRCGKRELATYGPRPPVPRNEDPAASSRTRPLPATIRRWCHRSRSRVRARSFPASSGSWTRLTQ